MAARTLRRRLRHGDVDGRRHEDMDISGIDDLNEPLLGNYGLRHGDVDGRRLRHGDVDESLAEVSTFADIWDDERKKEHLHWALVFSQLIAQWAQWIANIVLGSKSFIGRILPFPFAAQNGQTVKLLAPPLSPLQETRLKNLQLRLQVPFDGSCMEHQDGLRQLWRLAYPDRTLPPLKSELWKEMGWQGCDPSTDFRGGGYISLENLIFFAKNYPVAFQDLLHKRDGNRAEWEYPFAVAGINISFMLVQMLDIQSGKPGTLAGIRFLEFLSEDEEAFNNLYCIAFLMMDAQWLATGASYMEFNEVLKSTRAQLERELALEDVSGVKDLPAYNLLKR